MPKTIKEGAFKVLSAARVRINRGGYERDGSYWGTGLPLYRVIIEGPTPEGERFPVEYSVVARHTDRETAARGCMARAISYYQTWGREAPRELHAQVN